MRFGMAGRMGPGIRQVVGLGIGPRKEVSFEVNVARSEPLELRFGVVRVVGRGISGVAACSQITLGNLAVHVTG